MEVREEKYKRLIHRTPPNLAPQNYEIKKVETDAKRHSKFKILENWNQMRV